MDAPPTFPWCPGNGTWLEGGFTCSCITWSYYNRGCSERDIFYFILTENAMKTDAWWEEFFYLSLILIRTSIRFGYLIPSFLPGIFDLRNRRHAWLEQSFKPSKTKVSNRVFTLPHFDEILDHSCEAAGTVSDWIVLEHITDIFWHMNNVRDFCLTLNQ